MPAVIILMFISFIADRTNVYNNLLTVFQKKKWCALKMRVYHIRQKCRL